MGCALKTRLGGISGEWVILWRGLRYFEDNDVYDGNEWVGGLRGMLREVDSCGIVRE
jgi:hypothetical protein